MPVLCQDYPKKSKKIGSVSANNCLSNFGGTRIVFFVKKIMLPQIWDNK
jgi:hypothetical protein